MLIWLTQVGHALVRSAFCIFSWSPVYLWTHTNTKWAKQFFLIPVRYTCRPHVNGNTKTYTDTNTNKKTNTKTKQFFLKPRLCSAAGDGMTRKPCGRKQHHLPLNRWTIYSLFKNLCICICFCDTLVFGRSAYCSAINSELWLGNVLQWLLYAHIM